ncbi:MAG: hypothetical protein M1813_009203 [Trichoglossum hirsutum]|nr:MAG: hypothetical protein M1813_009203 [Trichoglossum hirsutum]
MSSQSFGMLLLNEGSHEDSSNAPGASNIDIVAVHGLSGYRTTSWGLANERVEKEKTWLKDAFSERIPGARVMTFGYESDIGTRGVISSTGIKDKAVKLLEALSTKESAVPHCPIVFIAHDLGGSIVKQALVIANNERKYWPIAAYTRRLVFFGTPHRAVDIHSWEELVFNIAFTSTQRPVSGFSKAVRESAKALLELSEEFYVVAGKYNILDIYAEGQGSTVVGKHEATLDALCEERVARKGDHPTFCKFSMEDKQLGLLCDKIEAASLSLDVDYIECLQALSSLYREIYRFPQSPQLLGTFEWVLSRKTYRSWLEISSPCILHLYGHQGSGRTVLSQLLFQSLREKCVGSTTIVVYFSFDKYRNSATELLASLGNQLLSYEPSLFGKVRYLYEQIKKQSSWTEDELWIFFRTLITERNEVLCVINALHECDSSRARLLQNLVTLRDSTETMFKVIITSGPQTDIRTALALCHPIDLDVQEEMQADMKRFIKNGVSRLIQKRPPLNEFEGDITANLSNHGIDFLWVNLTLQRLESARVRLAPVSIRKMLQSLPRTVPEIFRGILGSIAAEYHTWARKALTWILCAFRPMKVSELAAALAIDTDNISFDSTEERISRDLAGDLKQAFGPLIKIESNEVYLAHQRVKEFLCQAEGGGQEWYCVEHTAHSDLAQFCISYLSMISLENATSFLKHQDGWPELHLPKARRFDLLTYAVRYWPAHYRLAISTPRLSGRILGFLSDRKMMQVWSELHWRIGNPIIRPNISFNSPLPVAAQLGLPDVVEILLQQSARNIASACDRSLALGQAARGGYVEVVKQLLRSGLDDSAAAKSSLVEASAMGHELVMKELIHSITEMQGTAEYSPVILCRAAQLGFTAVVKQLLQAGADVDAVHDCSTPLHLAARSGHGSVVEALLQHKADVTALDNRGLMALHVAAYNGHSAVVKQLLEAKSDIEITDKRGFTPLYLATQNGYLSIAKLLLKVGAVPRATSSTSSTPLHQAAQHGYDELAELMLDNGADINSHDDKSNTPLHVAVLQKREEVVRLLVRRGAEVGSQNESGNTALHSAALLGLVPVIKMLLAAEAVPNVSNREGSTPLLLAAQGGFGEAVLLLLENKACTDIQNENKWTALHCAADEGHGTVVKFLLEGGAEFNVTTDAGWTALHMAAADGHDEVVQLLLEKGAEVDAVDGGEWTPLHRAAACDRGVAVELLVRGGATPKARDEDGCTPLHLAAQSGSIGAIKTLLGRGADIECQLLEYGWRPLHLAIRHLKATKLLLERGADVHAVGSEGNTPLTLAAEEGYSEVVKLLLDWGANPCAESENGATPLHKAARGGHEEVAQLLLEVGVDIDRQDRLGHTALQQATWRGNGGVARLLVSRGASLDCQDSDGDTALHGAVDQGSDSIVSLLLEAGAKPEITNKYGSTPLYEAAAAGHEAVFRLLLPHQADINGHSGAYGTLLQVSALNGREGLVKFLLDRGADVNVEGGEHGTALQGAAWGAREAVISILLQSGADIDIQGGLWGNALNAAAANCPDRVVQILLERGAKVNREDLQGRTAMHHAAWGGRLPVLQLILNVRRSLGGRDKQGRNVLHHAASGKSGVAVIKRILKDKNKYDVQDVDGWTPLHWACKGRNPHVVKLLLASGADPTAKDFQGWTPRKVAQFHDQRSLAYILAAATLKLSRRLSRRLTRRDTRRDSIVSVQSSVVESIVESIVESVGESVTEGEDEPPPDDDGPPISTGEYHEGISCDGCRYDIYGTRYKCEGCDRFDFCFKCIRTAQSTHPPEHKFREIKKAGKDRVWTVD